MPLRADCKLSRGEKWTLRLTVGATFAWMLLAALQKALWYLNGGK